MNFVFFLEERERRTHPALAAKRVAALLVGHVMRATGSWNGLVVGTRAPFFPLASTKRPSVWKIMMDESVIVLVEWGGVV